MLMHAAMLGDGMAAKPAKDSILQSLQWGDANPAVFNPAYHQHTLLWHIRYLCLLGCQAIDHGQRPSKYIVRPTFMAWGARGKRQQASTTMAKRAESRMV